MVLKAEELKDILLPISFPGLIEAGVSTSLVAIEVFDNSKTFRGVGESLFLSVEE